MRIAIVTSQYSRTGVPLAQTRLARAFEKAGHDVDLIFGYAGKDYDIENPKGVKVTVWKCSRAMHMLPKLIKFFTVKKPEIVLSAEDNTNAFILLAALLTRSKAKIGVSSRISPEGVYSDKVLSRGWLLKKFVGCVMFRADVWSCVSKDLADAYKKIFPQNNFECIYNIIDDALSRQRLKEPVNHPWLNGRQTNVCITAGTLAPRKGFDYLLKAISIVKKSGIDVKLIILGEGPQRLELEDLARDLALADDVRFEGAVANPLSYFSRSNVFVLSSLREGMPNVLIEGMLAGCTPVATDCPTGPREILESGRYGYLVPMKDPAALAVGIETALLTPVPSDILVEAIKPFHEDAVLAEHFRLLGI